MKKGFTFIEILVAVSILALLALLLANILPRAFDIYNTKLEEEERFSNVQIIFDRLAREIRQGSQVIDISQSTQTLGYLTLNLSSGGTVAYSYTLYNGKYYFTVDNEIQAGPIKELRFVGLDSSGTYTTLTSNIRTLSITVTMEDGKRYSTFLTMRAEISPVTYTVVITEVMYWPALYDRNGNPVNENVMEFIELYNASPYTISLKNWKINGNKINKAQGGTGGPNDVSIPPGKYALLTVKNSDLVTRYNNISLNVPVLEVIGNYLGWNNNTLNNSGDTITLEDDRGNIIETFTYDATWPGQRIGPEIIWGFPIYIVYYYYSMERKNMASSPQDRNNWKDSSTFNYLYEYWIFWPFLKEAHIVYCSPGRY